VRFACQRRRERLHVDKVAALELNPLTSTALTARYLLLRGLGKPKKGRAAVEVLDAQEGLVIERREPEGEAADHRAIGFFHASGLKTRHEYASAAVKGVLFSTIVGGYPGTLWDSRKDRVMNPVDRVLHRGAVKSKKERLAGIHNEVCLVCADDLDESKQDDHIAGQKHDDLVLATP
jgi:hypothetical protein